MENLLLSRKVLDKSKALAMRLVFLCKADGKFPIGSRCLHSLKKGRGRGQEQSLGPPFCFNNLSVNCGGGDKLKSAVNCILGRLTNH